MTTIQIPSGPELLRRVVQMMDHNNESFNTRYTAAELLMLYAACAASEYDYRPEEWSERQCEEALGSGMARGTDAISGLVPEWDYETCRPVHTGLQLPLSLHAGDERSEQGQRAARIVADVVSSIIKETWGRAPNTGGCRAFYAPGERVWNFPHTFEHTQRCVLIIAHDGGDLKPLFCADGEANYARRERLYARLRAEGFKLNLSYDSGTVSFVTKEAVT